jgi:hypothetical protein
MVTIIIIIIIYIYIFFLQVAKFEIFLYLVKGCFQVTEFHCDFEVNS